MEGLSRDSFEAEFGIRPSHSESRDDTRQWAKRYRAAMGMVFEYLTKMHEFNMSAVQESLIDELAQACPLLPKSMPLSQKAILSALSAGSDSVLVGMRLEKHVWDAFDALKRTRINSEQLSQLFANVPKFRALQPNFTPPPEKSPLQTPLLPPPSTTS